MIFPFIQCRNSVLKTRRTAGFLLLVVCASLFTIPEASAVDCSGYTLSGDAAQRVQLLNCVEDSSNSNTDTSANLTAPAGIIAGDFLIVNLVTDSNGATISNPAGWNAIAGLVGARGISSQVWWRIADGTESGNSFPFSWANGGERNYAYMLHFRGASGGFNFVSATQGNNITPDSQAVTPNSPDNLILRMTNFDDDDITVGLDPIIAGLNNIIFAESGAGTGTVSLGAVYTHQVGGPISSGTASFTLTAGEGSHRRTLSIEPIELRFSMPDTESSVCGIQQVTLSVTDRLGVPLTWFAGSVSLSATNSANAVWSAGPGLTNAVPVNTGGNVSYQFDPADGGTAVFEYYNPDPATVDFGVTFGNFSERVNYDNGGGDNYTGPILTVNPCEFRISYPTAQMGTCANQDITVSLVDAVTGAAATDYSGTVTITNGEGRGSYASAATNFANGAAGVASFDLDIAGGVGSSSAVLSYTDTTADPVVNFGITEDSGSGLTEDIGDPTNDPNLEVQACEIRVNVVDGSNESDVCTLGAITFSITTTGGTVVQGYDGDLVISTSSLQGDWFGGAGGLTNNGGGSASYNFVALTDLGVANLTLSHPFTGSVTFTVSGTAGNGAILGPSAGNVDTLTVVSCLVEITRSSATSEVCRNGQIVTYEIQDRDGVIVTGYEGTIILQSKNALVSPTIFSGDWEYDASATDPPTLEAQLNNGGGDDGIATLQFVAADGGSIDVRYVNEHTGTWYLDTIAAGFTLAPTSTADIAVSTCQFFISYSGPTPGEIDVCSIETVTIRLVDAGGTDITNADYAEEINLSTSGAGGGTWSDPGGNSGALTPGPAESGVATYKFEPGDNGSVTLQFTSLTSGSRNINASDGTTSDLGLVDATNDPSLSVDLCTFFISYTNGVDYEPASISACSFQDVTIEIRDRLGALATNFAGDIKVSVPLNKGDWSNSAASDIGTGTFNNGTADDGEMTYSFVSGDNGNVNFRFSSLEANDYNFEIENVVGVISGEILEDGSADPTLTITSCFPTVLSSSCSNVNDANADADGDPETVSIAVGDVSSLLDRIIIAVAATEGVASTPAAPTFNSVTMNLLRREQDATGSGSSLEMWYLLEADTIPASAGTYQGEFAGAVGDWGFCFLALSEVEQTLPTFIGGDPTTGTLNYNNANFDDPTNLIATTITTTVNNTLVIGATSSADAVNNWEFEDLSPEPPLTRIVGDTDDRNPGYATGAEAQFSIGAGVAPIAASITVSESEENYNPVVNTQIVAAFEPRVSGPPIAVGYEPVKLFQTYSGNMSYRAFGASLRPGTAACTFDNVGGLTSGATSVGTLSLPAAPMGGQSTVTAAWLYWFGSGSDDVGTTGVDSQITLIVDPNGTPSPTIVDAAEVFIIDNVGGSGTVDYFAGYADVTGVVTASGEYGVTGLEIDYGTPWSSSSACAGGWAMVVVYENDYEQLRVLNLFQGFQPFQNSAFTLVPRNFRMASPRPNGNFPNGQITHITVEGDYELANGDESLGIQVSPGSAAFTTLTTPFNPTQSEFNSTITYPVYSLQSTLEGDRYLFDSGAVGTNILNGYGIDFQFETPQVLGPYVAGGQVGTSYGVDVDTHYVQGANALETLNPFAATQAEEITTRYSSGQDLVLLVSEVISVTNAPLADIEMFKSGPAEATVDTTQAYTFTVTNNGDGTLAGGFANGEIIVTDILPTGLTFASVGTVDDDVSGTDWSCTETAVGVDPGAFTCTYDIAASYTYLVGPEPIPATPTRLGIGESLPPIVANVKIGDSSVFTAQSTDVTNVARVLHSGGSCTPESLGVSPDPATCTASPQFDNVNDLQGGTLDIDDIDEKTENNNNVSAITTTIKGIETDLSITKSVVGVLEVGSAAQYTISVTNNGPDVTTTAFTLSDAVPAGLTFDTVDPTTHADWNCTTTSPLFCTYSGAGLALATPIDVVLNVTVTGSAGENVTNIATVATATGNFDTDSGNNTATDITSIIAPPAATTERFLLSVSEDDITLGSLEFDRGDLVLYNPDSDTATPFFIDLDETSVDVDDIDAVHLLPNGHIVMSVDAAGTATGVGAFGGGEIIQWDPILKTSVKIFDGRSTGNGGVLDEDENIDAVYVLDNGHVVFSTEDAGSWNTDTVQWEKSDLLRWDGSAVTIYLDGSDATVFGNDLAQLDAAYVRVADADATMVKNAFWMSASTDPLGGTVTAGIDAGTFGNIFGQDDLLELIDPISEIVLAPLDDSTGNLLFSGNVPLGVFTGGSTDLRLDGVHIVEDGFHGHFSITEDQEGTTCAPGRIRITKHQGLTHVVDTDYAGTITIASSHGAGTWTLASGGGTLDDLYDGAGTGTTTDGQASYTFVSGDLGTVVLNFTTGVAGSPQSFDVNVSNNIVDESNDEDFDFDFLDDITNVIFADTFDTVDYGRSDGSTSWAGDWVDIDLVDIGGGDDGTGPGVGNILIEDDKLSITATSGAGSNPSISRAASFLNFDATEDVFLNFDYTYSGLSGGDEIIVEVSDDNGANFTTIATYTGIAGTNLITPQIQNLNINALISSPPAPPNTVIDLIDMNNNGITVQIRVSAGYLLSSKFFIDNLDISTGTNACGIGQISHYAVYIGDPIMTGNAATEIDGIACVGSLITIQGHDATDFPSEPGETITLRTLTTPAQKGSWASLVSGTGAFNDTGTLTDGIATYTFPPGETSATFRFNYTDPLVDGDNVNFNIDSGFPILAGEDPTLNVRQAGLVFYNETNPLDGMPNQISSKPSDTGFNSATIAIQAVRSSDNDPLQCVPLFEAGTTLDFEFALECVDPVNCGVEQGGDLDAYVNGSEIARVANNGTVGAPAPGIGGSYGADVAIPMIAQPSTDPGGTIQFVYKDAGNVQLHARWEIPLDNNPLGTTVGDYLTGETSIFNVRPFGFDIDFGDERFSTTVAGGGTDINTVSSYADDANDTVFASAGVPFATTVSAVGWELGEDDSPADGIPDSDADLSDNQVTRNFGNESMQDDYDVLIELNQVVAPASGVGELTDNRIADFTDGVSDPDLDLIFDEVGIIDLDARLVESAGSADDTFMGLIVGDDAGSVLKGAVKNVGRFVPANFKLELAADAPNSILPPSITPRSLARIQPSCSAPPSNPTDFTYMGEQFGFSANITARNALDAITRNYVGNYAKLSSADFTAGQFAAFNKLLSNADLSARLTDGPAGANRTLSWGLIPTDGDAGVATLMGDLVFDRAPSTDGGARPNEALPDGPYNALTLGLLDTLVSTEYVGSPDVTRPFVLDVDIGAVDSLDATEMLDGAFRYGRLILENAFGPETEPLEIAFHVEYWDSATSSFLLNSDDSCTTIEFDSATDLSDSPVNEKTDERSIRFLDGDNSLLESFEGNLDDGEVEIESEAVAETENVFVGLVNGVTAPQLTLSGAIADFETERQLEVSAPGFDTVPDPDEPNDGAVTIEFNLSDPDLGFSLDFLSYDWRTDPTELDDVTADLDYRDNPRARFDFGSYRGHDRVINWQEIYIGPN